MSQTSTCDLTCDQDGQWVNGGSLYLAFDPPNALNNLAWASYHLPSRPTAFTQDATLPNLAHIPPHPPSSPIPADRPASLPPSPPLSDEDASVSLRIDRLVALGEVWDVYHAMEQGRRSSASPRELCVKIAIDGGGRQQKNDGSTVKLKQLIENEHRLYGNELASVQGSLVPKYHALWSRSTGDGPSSGVVEAEDRETGEPAVWVQVLEWIGDCVTTVCGPKSTRESNPRGGDCFINLGAEMTNAIRDQYHRLHALGIVHRRLDTAHILVGNGSEIRLIDFTRSYAVNKSDGGSAAKELREEISTIKRHTSVPILGPRTEDSRIQTTLWKENVGPLPWMTA